MLPVNLNPKYTYAQRVRAVATQLAQVAVDMEEVGEIWLDRGYGPTNDDAITTDEVAAAGTNAAVLLEFMQMVNKMITFLNTAGTGETLPRVTLNKLRQDL